MIMTKTVQGLRPEAFKAKYIIVRDYGDGVLRWSRFSSNDYELTKNCVNYGNSISNLSYKKIMLETKDVLPTSDFLP